MANYNKINSILWDELTQIHVMAEESNYIDQLKSKKVLLKSTELEEVGDVRNKSLLHLQCHYGLDSLSWALLGAKVVGVDFSIKSIKYAQNLSTKFNIPAQFICCDIYELPIHLKRKFDIVYSSYGVLLWLSNLEKWAKLISNLLKKGGFFYLIEGHPYSMILKNSDDDYNLKITKDYFRHKKPKIGISENDYINRQYKIKNKSFTWNYAISDVLNTLTQANLKLEYLHEFPFSDNPYHKGMIKNKKNLWQFEKNSPQIPLTFSLKMYK